MAKFNQPGTDKGTRGETGEKISSKASASDRSGERSASIKNGVGLGKADKSGVALHGIGRGNMGANDGLTGEFNTGKSDGVSYEHKRQPHDQN